MSVDREALRELVRTITALNTDRVEELMPVAEAAYYMAMEDAGIYDDGLIYEEGYDDGYGDGYDFGYEAGLNDHAGDYLAQSARKVSPDV